MMHFPLLQMAEEWFYKFINRPDDYDKSRWSFYKKFMLVSSIIAVLVWVFLEVMKLHYIETGIAVIVIIIIVVDEYWRKKERVNWWHRWWKGQEPKWAVLWNL